MIRKLITRLITTIGSLGADPSDGDDLALQKLLLVLIASLTSIAGSLWGGIYLLFGESLAGSIPLTYAELAAFNVGIREARLA